MYVIFDNELKKLYKKPGPAGAIAKYSTLPGCKAAAARLNKKTPSNQFMKRYTISSEQYWMGRVDE